MQQLLIKNIDQLKKICRMHNVKRLYAFGSVCTDDFNENSDIDLIIAFNKRFFDGYVDNFLSLEAKLEDLFNKKVDIIAEETIQNPYFKKVVDKTKIPIYE